MFYSNMAFQFSVIHIWTIVGEIDGLVQDCDISITDGLEIPQSFTLSKKWPPYLKLYMFAVIKKLLIAGVLGTKQQKHMQNLLDHYP